MKKKRIDNGKPALKRPKKKSPSHEYKPEENPTAPEKRSRGPEAQYDWTLIRNEYVEGYLRPDAKDEFDRIFPTYAELNKRHGASLSAIRARGSRERWKNLKNTYAIELAQARQKKRANKLAHAAVQFDDNALRVGEMGVALVMSRLAEVGTEMKMRADIRKDALERLSKGEHVDPKELRSAVYHQEMQTLANAAEKFQQIGMRALGTSEEANSIMNVTVGDTNIGNTTNVSQELIRDDPERAKALVSAFVEAGAVPRAFVDAMVASDDAENSDIVQSEVVTEPKQISAKSPKPSQSVPRKAEMEDDEYEADPEIMALINSMPGVNVSELDPRMKQVSTEDEKPSYGGSDYDLPLTDPALYADEDAEDD